MNRVIVVLKPTEYRKHLTSFHAAIVYIYNNNVFIQYKYAYTNKFFKIMQYRTEIL